MTKRISLSLLTIAAMLSTGCDNKPKGQVARCVDEAGKVVGDDKCDNRPAPGSYGPYPFYRWYYGGTGFYPGQPAYGGSFQPSPDLPAYRATSAEGTAIIRGGFGSGFFGGS
ncbi:MAG: hypothetical protein WCB53_18870 [Terriglobales bacterium]